ncbi:MAG: GNAT family N-acetyltransferase [Candidatus Melainabacteria bacterium]|nr:GNAT family N-acetyltransferase [Candidatus Melainabacteria bacterium]
MNTPDFQLIARDEKGFEVGGFSLWHSDTPTLKGRRVGILGDYRARDAATGVELLHSACRKFEELGIKTVVGPMNGSTWNQYRLTTEGFDSPPFALECLTPKEYVHHFEAAGFRQIASYASAIVAAEKDFDRSGEALERLQKRGFLIRSFRKDRSLEELAGMYRIAIDSFKDNFLYSPISQNQFTAMYEPLVQIIDERLVFIAEKDGSMAGFLLALPNKLLASGRDDTVVIKSLARLSGDSFRGLGLGLVSACHERAAELGYEKIIHALYKDDNRSGTFSADADLLRRYALYLHE